MKTFFRELWFLIKSTFQVVEPVCYKPLPKLEVPERETPNEEELKHIKCRLGVIVGHEKKAPGALMANTRETEYSYNSRVASAMTQMADSYGIDVQVIYRDGIGIEGAYRKADELLCDYVIELHFNAFNRKASGTLTLCSTDMQDIEFSRFVQHEMCRVFNRHGSSRGVQPIPRSGRGGKSVYSFPDGRNCLVEPFFGDNPKESELAYEKLEEYAACLLKAVSSFHPRVEIYEEEKLA